MLVSFLYANLPLVFREYLSFTPLEIVCLRYNQSRPIRPTSIFKGNLLGENFNGAFTANTNHVAGFMFLYPTFIPTRCRIDFPVEE